MSSEDQSEDLGCIPLIICVVIGLVIGTGIGVTVMEHGKLVPLRAKAVELGAAEWLVDPKDGTTKFTWKEKLEKP